MIPPGCRVVALFLAILLSAASASADDKKAAPAEPDYAAELPRIPAKSPEAALNSFHVKPGFHLELVASEPLIRSPMAIDFDEFGRAFVVELPEYNQYASAKPHGRGAVKMLEDTNGDGRYDRATVFVDDLNYPTAVACWDGGILVGVAPDILFCKDTDGDGKADIRNRLYTGFGMDKAGEGMLNSFRWRIDNRFHIPTGLDGGDIVPAAASDKSDNSASRPISARGQHLLLEPRGMTISATSGGGQHGMSLDDWSVLAFVCGNSEPAHLVMYDGRYLARNPYLTAPAAAVNIAPEGKFTKLMRTSAVEPWRVLRTRLRSKGVIPGSDEGGTPSGFFTGATGITMYRGDAWPAEYRGQLFVGEVANNLVYRARLETKPDAIAYAAHRADSSAEFLASDDNWFRPVQFANAPDGTLYVIDMYRELIEGAAFLAPQILKHMDPSSGADKGRIYRIAPDGFQNKRLPRIGDKQGAELAALLEHPNAWHRETASRLIYQRQQATAAPALRELAAGSRVPLARAMALHSLRGLGLLEPAAVVKALHDADPNVRIQALKLSESMTGQPEVRAAVLDLVEDPDLRVRYQTAFTLGEFSGAESTSALALLTVKQAADPWFRLALLSSIGARRGEYLAALLERAAGQPPTKSTNEIFREVAAEIGAANAANDVSQLLRLVDSPKWKSWNEALPAEMIRAAAARQPASHGLLAGASSGKTREILEAMVRDARESAVDDRKPVEARTAAIRTLGVGKLADLNDLFGELLQSRQPQPVQSAALETLARLDDAGVPAIILSAWASLTPQLRATAVETLLARPAWIGAFLDAVEKQKIAPADLDPARIVLLKKHSDSDIRARAEKLFAGQTLARRQQVVDAYQKALELKGDIDRGRMTFRKVCAACHKLEGVGESIGADLNAIRDRGTAAVMLNILDPNREVKPQFLTYVVVLDTGLTVTGMITAETATSLTLRKSDGKTESVLRVNIDEMKSTGLSFMPEGLEKQIDAAAMADLLAYLNSIR